MSVPPAHTDDRLHLTNPERINAFQVEFVLDTLALPQDGVVADIGSGPGTNERLRQSRISRLYLIRCGWSASLPRRRLRSAS